jgi:AraC family transcriptional regulator, arabinose operon regulatory protein
MKKTVFPIQTENESRLPYFVFSIGLDYNQEHIIRTGGYPCYMWIQSRSGSGRLVLGEQEYLVPEGQGIFLMPHEPHEYYPETDEWLIDWVAVSGSGVTEFLEKLAGITRSGVYYVANPGAIHKTLEQIREVEQTQDPLRNLTLSTLTYQVLTQLYQFVSSSSTNSLASRYTRLIPVLEHIDAHYAEAITLKDLSDLLGVTPQHLCTLFRKIMNTRIFEYINLVRIKKSKEFLLGQPKMAIRDVAHANGFEDVSYFCYIFKRIEKITPGDFRRLYVRT